QAESLLRTAESDRHAWDAQRRTLEREVEHLRGQVARQPEGSGAGGPPDAKSALDALEDENRRLRAACAKLERAAGASKQAEALLRTAESDRHAWDAQRRTLEREVEHLRGQVARQPEGSGAGGPPDAKSALDALEDENRRLRAACAKLERAAGASKQAEAL